MFCRRVLDQLVVPFQVPGNSVELRGVVHGLTGLSLQSLNRHCHNTPPPGHCSDFDGSQKKKSCFSDLVTSAVLPGAVKACRMDSLARCAALVDAPVCKTYQSRPESYQSEPRFEVVPAAAMPCRTQ